MVVGSVSGWTSGERGQAGISLGVIVRLFCGGVLVAIGPPWGVRRVNPLGVSFADGVVGVLIGVVGAKGCSCLWVWFFSRLFYSGETATQLIRRWGKLGMVVVGEVWMMVAVGVLAKEKVIKAEKVSL